MTLDLEKFISNSIKTQTKIQHLDIKTKTVKDAPESVKQLIVNEYGDNYLLDADYVSFFWGAIGKEEVKKLFNVVDKALGKSANKLTETDFKKINLEASSEEPKLEKDTAKDAEQEELPKKTKSSNEDLTDDSQNAEDELDEDDGSIESPTIKTSYFFLKITLK